MVNLKKEELLHVSGSSDQYKCYCKMYGDWDLVPIYFGRTSNANICHNGCVELTTKLNERLVDVDNNAKTTAGNIMSYAIVAIVTSLSFVALAVVMKQLLPMNMKQSSCQA